MMRVIGGQLRGRRLFTPRGEQTRPTLGRVRQSLFDRLTPFLAGASCLDLFAGSGALGIEALSRGADECWFVDLSPAALACLRRNLNELGLVARSHVVAASVLSFLQQAVGLALARPWSLVFADPPYGRGLVQPSLAALAALAGVAGVLADGGWVVMQHSPREELGGVPPNMRLARSDRYGDTLLTTLQVTAEGQEGQR